MSNYICPNKAILAIYDSMDVLNGKWKISILSSMCYFNERRFSDIGNDLKGIYNKQLSKELKELEQNKLVTRTVITPQLCAWKDRNGSSVSSYVTRQT